MELWCFSRQQVLRNYWHSSSQVHSQSLPSSAFLEHTLLVNGSVKVLVWAIDCYQFKMTHRFRAKWKIPCVVHLRTSIYNWEALLSSHCALLIQFIVPALILMMRGCSARARAFHLWLLVTTPSNWFSTSISIAEVSSISPCGYRETDTNLIRKSVFKRANLMRMPSAYHTNI